ncbi:MAG: hypothetical protein ACD_33C00036G0012 [uncultured bacterium]|nr:MAG: hypothetical protein ACD_33C00036G0012 [uncultured bacterium]
MATKDKYSINSDGNLLESDEKNNVVRVIGYKTDFPMDAKTITQWLNHAFRTGLNTKRQHFNDLLSNID